MGANSWRWKLVAGAVCLWFAGGCGDGDGTPDGAQDAGGDPFESDAGSSEVCDDGVDNDDDMSVDCRDQDCDGTSVCSFVQLDANWLHACGVLDSGDVFCWGIGEDGQIGHGETPATPVGPTRVEGLGPMVDVDVGMRHSCALGADGTVHCWGKNREGQLGDDSFVDSPFPVQVAELTDATAIAAGGLHTCAITGRQSESRVYCWGLNDRNQVGVSTGGETRVPVQVAANGLPLIGYTDIGLGIGHTCAMGPSRDPGIQTVMCWGSNRSGQLGIGSSEVKITVPQRIVRQTSDNNAIWDFVAGSLAVGTSSTCASRDGGSVWCWGYGPPGHFGSEELSDFQYSAVEHPGLSDARRLWHGSHHVCAERASGRVVCWGNNGRLAFDDESTVHYNPVVLHDVVEPNDVAPGSDFTCWADSDGRAFCQGASEYGQLGDPSLIEVTAEPQRVYPEWSVP